MSQPPPHVFRRTCHHPAVHCCTRAAQTSFPAHTAGRPDENPTLMFRLDGNCPFPQVTNATLQDQFSPRWENLPCPDMTPAGIQSRPSLKQLAWGP